MMMMRTKQDNKKEVKEASRIKAFISKCVRDAGAAGGAIVGVSGGLDSAVVATLAVQALGKRRVMAVFLPTSENTPQRDHDDADRLFNFLGLDFMELNIDPIVAKYPPFSDSKTKGNLAARVRMTLLYAWANTFDMIVLGTGDKSEFTLGYFTKWGDGAADVMPIAHLYKTEVKKLARHLHIPQSIIDKPSGPGLVSGVNAQSELFGLSYDQIDEMLEGYQRMDQGLARLIERNKHKTEKIKCLQRLNSNHHHHHQERI